VLVPSLSAFVKIVAVSALVGLVALQIAGIRVSSRFQEATTAVKFFRVLAVVVAALLLAPAAAAKAAAVVSPASLVGVVVALQSGS